VSAARGGRAALACLALALCSALVVASAPPAAADPGPPVPTTPPPPAATSPPPVPLTPPSGDSADDEKSDTIPETVLGPTPKWGVDTAPLGHYHVYYDDGSSSGPLGLPGKPPSIFGSLEGFLTDGVFTLGRWTVAFGIGALGWVYGSTLRQWINDQVEPAARVAGVINRDILGPLNVAGFFLLLTLVYAGWQTFRGRATAGVGEFGLSLVIYMVALMALSDPVDGFLSAVNGVTDIAGQVMDASLANGLSADGIAGAARCPRPHQTDGHHAALVTNARRRGELPPDFKSMQCVLRVELVDVPYDLLNWGEVIKYKPGEACWDNRQKILAQGPGSGGDEKVSDLLGAGGCKIKLSKNPSLDRFFAALLFMLSIIVMVGLLITFAVIVLIALLTGIFLLILVWPIFAMGLLPGQGRRVFWRWMTAFGASLASVIAMSAFLALLVWGCAEALETTDGVPIAFRFLLMNLVGIMLLRLRRTMLHRVTVAVRNLGDRMPGARGAALAGAGGAGAIAGAGAAAGGGAIRWGGHPARPRPGGDGQGFSPWIRPASYQSPRLAAPNELSAQLERKLWGSPAARPLVRARRGVTYPLRHPVRTATAPVRAPVRAAAHPVRTLTAPVRAAGNAVAHPVRTARRPWAPLPGPGGRPSDGDGYPDNHHPWIPD
jgi:hypothetical protein